MDGSAWLDGLSLLLTWQGFILVFAGTTVGIIGGALPGIGPILILALALPMTYGMAPHAALFLLGALYCGSMYGGSIASILLNTPGHAASAPTAFDGYPMAQQGKAMVALGISTFASFVGGVIGVLALIFFSPYITTFALKFGPSEYFMLILFGLTMIALVSRGNVIKGLISGCLGLIFSYFGPDPMIGFPRFSFGTLYLQDGIQFVPAVMGLFAISELLSLISKKGTISQTAALTGNLFDGVKITLKHYGVLIKCSILGAVIGAVPGVGATTASFYGYSEAVRAAREPDTFGKGNPEGVIAPEAANNACCGGALIPTMTFGIPGGSSAAIFIAGILLHGLIPGPKLFASNPDLVASFFGSLFLSQFALLICGMIICYYCARIVIMPIALIIPSVVVFSFVGAYALRNSISDVIVIFVFGIIGFFFKKCGYPLAAMVVGMVLGSMAETSFFQALVISDYNYGTFFSGIINQVMWGIIFLVCLGPYISPLITRAKNSKVVS